MSDRTPTRRWFCPTPSWLIVALLAVEGLLFLSGRFHWPTCHKGYAVLIAVASVGVVFASAALWLVVACSSDGDFSSASVVAHLTVAVAIPFSWLAVEMLREVQHDAVVALRQEDWNTTRAG